MLIAAIVIIYLLIAFGVYELIIKKWDGKSTFEKIYFSLIWILVLPLWLIHKAYNSLI